MPAAVAAVLAGHLHGIQTGDRPVFHAGAPHERHRVEQLHPAITEGGVLRAMVNSAIITVCATVLTCVIGAMAAYPLARRLSKFNKVVSTVILSLMMIPPLSVLVPVYSMMVKIGGVNTYWGIILLSTAGNLPLAIFLYTSFIKAIPVSIDEAGMIDGANRATIFFRLIMPLLAGDRDGDHHDQCRRLERIRHVQLPAHRPCLPGPSRRASRRSSPSRAATWA